MELIDGVPYHTEYLPVINNGAPVVRVCDLCGAVVFNLWTHADWHAEAGEHWE